MTNYKSQINPKQSGIISLGFRKLVVFCFLIFLISPASFGQFFQGIGITAGVTKAKQKWFLTQVDGSETTIKKKNVFGFNGSLRAEFVDSEWFRWVTEFQFNQKGCKDKTDSASYKNKLNYICWNNFLKFQYETFEGFPYLLMGPRVEYTLSQAKGSPALSAGAFKTFNFSLSAGVGFEKIVFSNFKPFIELHYNPDTKYYYALETDPISVRNRAWELRLGIIYRPGGADCPTVVY